jgi:nucleotide-binding universal stress UspA family protein
MNVNVRRVLCAVDFSDCSGRALYAAAAFAKRYDAHLSAVHVHLPLSRPRATPDAVAEADQKSRPLVAAGPSVASARFEFSLDSIERSQLDAALRHLVTLETGIVHPDAVVEEACDVSAAILARAAQDHADLIVLGTHRRHALQHFMLGSVAEKVLRRAPCAVLMVPPTASRDASPSLGRILCALDFADGLMVALQYGRDLAEAAAAQLTVLHVIELPAAGVDTSEADVAGYRVARFGYARECMKASLADVRGRCDVHELLLVGKPEQEIIRIASEQESDLIVMGIHGRSAVDLALAGSVTHHVVRHAPCPVLAVRAEARARHDVGT